MSADIAYLSLLLDAPLQSWGFASRFQRRTTGLHPTKSGVIGLICAAMGHEKRPIEEDVLLRRLSGLRMTTIAMPRYDVRRMEDFHTVGGGYDKETQRQSVPRKASGGPCDNPTVTRRQYLLDARFSVILAGDRELLERVATALQDPVWGVWLGRKNCIPAAPVFVELCESRDAAWKAILRVCKLSEETLMETFTSVTEVDDFDRVTDSLNDQPVSFGDGTSSGPDKRLFAVRRVAVRPGIRQS
jgi:CRISPR system Cascade subunit CasD